METTHQVFVGDAREMAQIDDNAVELVVTSPPYPMIDMWDDLFAKLRPDARAALDEGHGDVAFQLMHEELDKVWAEVSRVMVPGGIACINIGDATRKVDGSFQVYPNHVEITDTFRELGFQPLPDILWRKPANSAAKFMGSGMLPPNAYATLEHEYILIFRNGETQRSFEPGSERRYSSAYFWEERNEWFSDVWLDIRGALQALNHSELRERSAAFPLELPYRLINMYSVYGNTVLDPFWGTGTTSMAAMASARNSIGYELEEEFTRVFDDRVQQVAQMSWDITGKRLEDHRAFVEERLAADKELKYEADNYDFPVTTKQEKQLQFYGVDAIAEMETGYRADHVPVENVEQDGIEVVSQDPGASQSTLGSDFE